MGRHQYLERLALGRSPFLDPPTNETNGDSSTLPAVETTSCSPEDGHNYVQQYNAKGRPINPSTEARNQAMRHAQNAVLALVGVVESRDQQERQSEKEEIELRKNRKKSLELENESGEDMELVEKGLLEVTAWWPSICIARTLAGVWPSGKSITDILTPDLAKVRPVDKIALWFFMYAGMPLSICNALLGYFLDEGVVESVHRLAVGLNKAVWRKRHVKTMVDAMAALNTGLSLAADLVLLPLQYYCWSQFLGLAPPRPILPTWQLYRRMLAISPENPLLTPLRPSSPLTLLTSPLALLLSWERILVSRRYGYAMPISFTKFEYPSVNIPVYNVAKPDFFADPVGRMFYYGYLGRVKILSWLGWYPLGQRFDELSNVDANASRTCTVDHGQHDNWTDHLPHHHRMNLLASNTAAYLGTRIDNFFCRLVLLPFETMVYRSITNSYLTSTLPKTSYAVELAAGRFTPSNGGLMRSYLSTLGLSLAAHSAIEVVLFFVVYGCVRWQGIRTFDWGGRVQRKNS